MMAVYDGCGNHGAEVGYEVVVANYSQTFGANLEQMHKDSPPRYLEGLSLRSPRGHSMTCNSLIFKHGLENEQQINKQLFSITVL